MCVIAYSVPKKFYPRRFQKSSLLKISRKPFSYLHTHASKGLGMVGGIPRCSVCATLRTAPLHCLTEQCQVIFSFKMPESLCAIYEYPQQFRSWLHWQGTHKFGMLQPHDLGRGQIITTFFFVKSWARFTIQTWGGVSSGPDSSERYFDNFLSAQKKPHKKPWKSKNATITPTHAQNTNS